MSDLVARLIREGGARVHELRFMEGHYVLRLKVRDLGRLRLVRHADRVLTRREAGEWIDMVRSCRGYLPRAKGAA